jgi:hypothetical protein
MSSVSYQGVQLPVSLLCERLSRGRGPRFAVIDGAQATAHTPATDLAHCDLFLTSCHKWLRAHLPLGFAVCPRSRSAGFIRATLAGMVASFKVDDPLLRFTEELEAVRLLPPYGETVGVTSLFTARAAAEDYLGGARAEPGFAALLENADEAAAAAREAGWCPLRPHPSLRSGMLLLEPPVGAAGAGAADGLRTRFAEAGVILTAYEGGRVRLSMPNRPWGKGDLDRLRSALQTAE